MEVYIMGTKAIKILAEMAFSEYKNLHPNFPYPVKPKYNDRTANGLTKCIIDFLNLKGFQAERIANQGRYIEGAIYTDVIGIKRQFPGKWIPGSGTRGTADISATIKGRSVKIEVKVGADRQSEAQKQYQKKIEQAGGIYIIAKDFQSFYEWFNSKFYGNG
jgi:hypothetical protein